MNGAGAPHTPHTPYSENELREGLARRAGEEDLGLLLGGMADRAVAHGRRLARRRRAMTVAVGLMAVAVAATAAVYARPGHDAGPAAPPVVGVDTLGATAMIAYDATCFDGPAGAPSLRSFVWGPAFQTYAVRASAASVVLSPDGRTALLHTGITQAGTTSYAVAPWTEVAAGSVPATAFRTFPGTTDLAWSTDGKALIDRAAAERDSVGAGPGAESVDVYDPATFAKTTKRLPAEIPGLTESARPGGAWRITGVTGTSSDLAITVMAPNAKEVRVYDGSGGSYAVMQLSNVPARITADRMFTTVFSPDGRFLLLRGSTDLAVFDLESHGRLVFQTRRGSAVTPGRPSLKEFQFLGWTAHDQLFGVVRWSTANRQDLGVHQRIELLTPSGQEVAATEVSVPGDPGRVCTLFSAAIGPADSFPGAVKL